MLVISTPLAFVRTSTGTVQLHEGDTVPAEADPDHVAVLTEHGVLSDPEPATPAPAPAKPGKAKG